MTKDFPVTEAEVKAWAESFKPDEVVASPRNSQSCPLAKAAIAKGHSVRVYESYWQWDVYSYDLSPRWQKFIAEIDRNRNRHNITAGIVLAALEATK